MLSAMLPPRPTPAKSRTIYRRPPRKKARDDNPVKEAAVASAATDEERDFFLAWVTERNIDKQYFVLALTYWMRVRSKIWTCFLVHPKEFYMIACIHIALKWLGYDEVLKCNFVQDLREVAPVSMETHQGIEFLILCELQWDL